jgi:hypothetical protein
MVNSTVAELPTTISVGASNHRDTDHEEIHQRLGGAGTYSPPPPLGTGSDDRAQLITWLASTPADCTVAFDTGYLLSMAGGTTGLPLPSGRRYVGRGVAEAANPAHFTLMNGVNPAGAIAGVVVAKEWDDNNTSAGGPTIYENLAIDGNAANNTGTYSCFIPFNYWARIRWCRFDSPRLHHIYLTRQMKNGTDCTPDLADNRIHGNRMRLGLAGTDGAMIRKYQPGGGGNHDADVRCWDNHGESLQHGIWLDDAAGWTIYDNHVWCQRHGINIENGFYSSKVVMNYVDAFGVDNAAATTYYGIRVRGFEGPGCIVAFNHVDSADTVSAGTHYCYYLEAQNALAHIAGGFNEASTHGAAVSNLHGFMYTGTNGLVQIAQYGNIAPVGANGFVAGQDFEQAFGSGGSMTLLYPRPMTGTATWNPGAVTAGTISTVAVTVTGARAGDTVHVGWTPALATLTSWRVWWAVTANDTVTVCFENRSGASITPSSTTVRATVMNQRA